MGKSLLDKVWDAHAVRELPNGQTQLLIGTHLLHEVTSPQAFAMIKELGLPVKYPERTFATVDHIVPTESQVRPFKDDLAEEMMQALADSCDEHKIKFFDLKSQEQGVIHVIGPEKGLTHPGMTIACGDSHTSTHGAMGAIAFGIGTSQIRDVLASGCLQMSKPKLRKIQIDGDLRPGVYAKDVILTVIHHLGVKGGVGYAYEYAGTTLENMSIEERLTVCNMSIEGGARCGYINPDQTTFDYLEGLDYSPSGADFDKAVEYWKSVASDADAVYDDVFTLKAEDIEPMVTWGINPAQSVPVSVNIPRLSDVEDDEKNSISEALEYMQFSEGQSIKGAKVDVTFVGSCTNGRISDLRVAAEVAKGRQVADGVKALIVPGSIRVAKQAVEEGLDTIFKEAGFEWRLAGCSMCLAMNPDKLQGDQLCASSSNRNFKGRQGSPIGRTLL
ncbi:MAG: 3-isopropylmalate dehydratase large subunit, partial [Lentisphaeria bacterium]|nr:3-isopropylmalate dehydratase large subunit [Lentisphaeria bacterium]NQZ69682.1 3-isopropylmalate dehydratase large subunit [Lentisphaeria bacterium]